jgi:hypothetical protein
MATAGWNECMPSNASLSYVRNHDWKEAIAYVYCMFLDVPVLPLVRCFPIANENIDNPKLVGLKDFNVRHHPLVGQKKREPWFFFHTVTGQ